MKYKSKIDWWMKLTFWGFTAITLWLIYLLFFGERDAEIIIVAIIFIIFELFLMIPLYFGTYYRLDDKELFVRCWIIKERIPYNSIVSMKETRTPWSSSAALSLDRLEIKYTKNKRWPSSTLISPKDKQEFMKMLQAKIDSEK